MIAIDNVQKIYKGTSTVHALNNITLKICDGEFVSIVGPSGCGKSTLLKICAGLTKPTKGKILFDHEKVSMVFQNHVLLPWRTVKQNIALPMELTGANAGVQKIIRLVDLAEFTDSYPSELSGGMKQMVAIGRALIYDPHVLLMDEPFGSLDELTRNKFNMNLLSIWKTLNPTILFVTHSISEAVLLSDRVVVLSKRPGAVKDVININLPRPRSIDMKETCEFQEYVRCIRQEIE